MRVNNTSLPIGSLHDSGMAGDHTAILGYVAHTIFAAGSTAVC